MAARPPLRTLLAHGDRRTVGKVNQVVETVLAAPECTGDLVQCAFDPDAAVRMRSADALEKISRQHATLLQPYAALLLGSLEETDQQEMQWHLAVILPRLRLTQTQRSRLVNALQRCLQAKSSIARTFALQGMSDLARQDASLTPRVIDLLQAAERSGTAAMKARSRKLLAELTQAKQPGRRKPRV